MHTLHTYIHTYTPRYIQVHIHTIPYHTYIHTYTHNMHTHTPSPSPPPRYLTCHTVLSNSKKRCIGTLQAHPWKRRTWPFLPSSTGKQQNIKSEPIEPDQPGRKYMGKIMLFRQQLRSKNVYFTLNSKSLQHCTTTKNLPVSSC